MTEITHAIIRGEVIIALLAACCAMGAYIGTGPR